MKIAQGVYALVHRPSRTWYVGQSANLEQRKRQHLGGRKPLGEFFRQDFKFVVLKLESNPHKRRALEAHWIDLARSKRQILNKTDGKGWYLAPRPPRRRRSSLGGRAYEVRDAL